MEIGIMTYTHGLTMELTLQQFQEYIAEAKFEDQIYFKQMLELYQQALEYSRQIRELSDMFRVKNEISVKEFFQQQPIFNIKKNKLILLQNDNSKDYFIALKLKIIQDFQANWCAGLNQISWGRVNRYKQNQANDQKHFQRNISSQCKRASSRYGNYCQLLNLILI